MAFWIFLLLILLDDSQSRSVIYKANFHRTRGRTYRLMVACDCPVQGLAPRLTLWHAGSSPDRVSVFCWSKAQSTRRVHSQASLPLRYLRLLKPSEDQHCKGVIEARGRAAEGGCHLFQCQRSRIEVDATQFALEKLWLDQKAIGLLFICCW